jgi:hypothetical protein
MRPIARCVLILVYDTMAILCGLSAALVLRFGGDIPAEYASALA